MPELDPVQAIRDQCADMVARAGKFRRQVSEAMPRQGAPPAAVADALVVVRGLLDPVEEIHVQLIGFRASARARARVAADAVADAWDAASVRLRRTAVSDRYQSGRQHEADVNLEVLELRRPARQAELVRDIAEGAERQVDIIRRGIESCRNDLAARLRQLQHESNLER